MYLVELIFPSTSVIVPTPSLQIHPKNVKTHGRCHYNFHTVLSIACSTFILLFTTHTHVNSYLVNTTFHQKILFYSIVFVLSSVVYFGTITHDFFLFSTKCSVFSQKFSCESHKLLNRLWIDLLQIGTGTDWLNSFIKSLKFSSTILFYNHYQCMLTLLARRSGSTCSRLVFYIFPLIKSF